MSAGRLGCMTTPAQGARIPDGALYACDNSRFGSDGKGRYWPGAQAWFDWLSRTVHRYGPDRCLWALAPDQPFDAAATLTQSLPWLARIRALGVPAAYAAQDGCEEPGLLPWDAFDVLFLAGSTEWKLGTVAERLAREAKARGKAVHMGRVNSRTRLGIAEWFGCDSADGTYLAYGPDKNLPRLLRWLDELDGRPSLVGTLTATPLPPPTTRHDTEKAPMTQPSTPTDPTSHYVYGRIILDLTDRLNATESFETSAQYVDHILEPTDGLLERLAEFFEAAAEKAKESEADDGFDLHHDLQDAAATVRALGEDLHLTVDRLNALAPPQPHSRRHTTADAADRRSPRLPGPPASSTGPSTGRTR